MFEIGCTSETCLNCVLFKTVYVQTHIIHIYFFISCGCVSKLWCHIVLNTHSHVLSLRYAYLSLSLSLSIYIYTEREREREPPPTTDQQSGEENNKRIILCY